MLNISPLQALSLGFHLMRRAFLEAIRDNNVCVHIETTEDTNDPE